MTSSAKTILGLLAVGAAGVAVGMLLAPEKGAKTRDSLKASISDLGEKIMGFISEGKEHFEDVAEDVKGEAKGLKDDVTKRVENTKQALS